MLTSLRKVPIIRNRSAAGRKFMRNLNDARQQRDAEVTAKVGAVIDAVRTEGDKALLRYTEMFDKVRLTSANIKVTTAQIDAASARISRELKEAIKVSAKRIEAYHRKQARDGFSMTTAEGKLSQLIVPLRRVGLYIPGGFTVYPSSVLMNAIPVRVAGVPEIVAITPPRSELDPGIAFALKLLKVTEVYRIGGAQSVAALACGTKTIAAVDKIVGPGNAYVQTAKRLLYGTIDIDSIAGLSEVVILADSTARPDWVALDMLAQAEHGTGDEFAVCVTDNAAYAETVAEAVQHEISQSPVKQVIDRLPKQPHPVSGAWRHTYRCSPGPKPLFIMR
jgi:histidinol dehydrogenase